MNLDSYRKIFEVGEIPPSLAPLHAPKFFCRFCARWNVVQINRLAIHLLGERQKHLRQIARGLQTIGTRAVIPLLVSLQLQLKAQIFNLQIVGTPSLLFSKFTLSIALPHQRAQHSF